MVSGFFTSPCDHWRMSSAVARPIRNSSKKLTSSTWYPSCRYCKSKCHRRARRGPFARPPPHALDLVDAGYALVRAAGEIDAELLRRAEHLVVRLTQLESHAVGGQHLDVETQRLELLEKHLEGLRDARLRDVLAL